MPTRLHLQIEHTFCIIITNKRSDGGDRVKKLLLKSRFEHKPVDMIYLDRNGSITQRTIFVKRVTDTHVIAFCTTREQQRTFQLDNILSAQQSQGLMRYIPHEVTLPLLRHDRH